MTSFAPYDDPALAARTRGWMQSTAPVAAPERLVFGVMDEVERSPRQRRAALAGLPILTGVARYAALTVVITIGVAAGIMVSRNVENVGGPTPPPTPTPALEFIGELSLDGRLLASDTSRAWVVTGTRQLIPIDAAGATGEAIDLTFMPADLAAVTDSSLDYGGPETVWLVAPDTDLLRVDPTVGEFAAAQGASGARLALGAGAAWISRADAVVEVDAAFMTLRGTVAVPGHRVDDPVVVVNDEAWVADATGIARLDPSTGGPLGRIPVVATDLVVARGLVWAAEGRRLRAINPDSGEVSATATLPLDIAPIVALATHGDLIWLATEAGPGGPLLIGVDAATGRTISLTPLTAPTISIAVVGNQVWTLDAAGHIGRFEPGP